MSKKKAKKPRKPRLTIERTGSAKYPFLFLVKWPTQPWKNSQCHTWEEALINLGLKER